MRNSPRNWPRATSKVALRDPEGVMLAVLHVEEVWQPDREAEVQAVFDTTSARPSRRRLRHQQGESLVRRRHASKASRSRITTIFATCA